MIPKSLVTGTMVSELCNKIEGLTVDDFKIMPRRNFTEVEIHNIHMSNAEVISRFSELSATWMHLAGHVIQVNVDVNHYGVDIHQVSLRILWDRKLDTTHANYNNQHSESTRKTGTKPI